MKKRHLPNLTNVFVGLASILLVATFFMPGWTAERVARHEGRAEELARLLLEVASEREPNLALAADRDAIREAFLEAALTELALPPSARPEALQVEIEGDEPRVLFRTESYLFQLNRRPEAQATPGEGRALEVYAWPLSELSPGRAAFFVPEGGSPAFTRNLHAGFSGLDKPGAIPAPGSGWPREEEEAERIAERGWYRSFDDERWLLLHD